MNTLRIAGPVCLIAALVSSVARADDRPAAPFAQRASWSLPDVDAVRQQVFEWLETADAGEEVQTAAAALWESAAAAGNEAHLLDVTCATIALADPQARPLVEACLRPRQGVALPEVAWLAEESVQPVERNNLRLLYARWLIQEMLYDEAAAQLAGLKPEDVVDPAGLLFYQSVVQHRTLARDEGLATIGRLLENEEQIPRRYVSLARLMQADLDGLKDDSLDHIARRMEDIQRRWIWAAPAPRCARSKTA